MIDDLLHSLIIYSLICDQIVPVHCNRYVSPTSNIQLTASGILFYIIIPFSFCIDICFIYFLIDLIKLVGPTHLMKNHDWLQNTIIPYSVVSHFPALDLSIPLFQTRTAFCIWDIVLHYNAFFSFHTCVSASVIARPIHQFNLYLSRSLHLTALAMGLYIILIILSLHLMALAMGLYINLIYLSLSFSILQLLCWTYTSI